MQKAASIALLVIECLFMFPALVGAAAIVFIMFTRAKEFKVDGILAVVALWFFLAVIHFLRVS